MGGGIGGGGPVAICNKSSQRRHSPTRAQPSASRGSPARHQPATTSHQAHQLATTTASGSAIRKNTSHHQGHHRAHPARLQPHRAAAPRRARKGPPPSRLGEDTRRPSSSPQRTSRGPRGVLPGARQGHSPTRRDPKMGIGVSGEKKPRGSGLCRRSACVSLVFGLSPVERSEWDLGGGVARRGALHLCMEKCLIGKARPVAPTELQSEGAVSHLGVHT